MNATVSQRPADVLVLGSHRSGTSALARALNLMGLALPKDLMSPGKANVLGHWEPLRISRFNDRLLEDVERSWFDPKPMPDGWLETAAETRLGEAVGLLQSERQDQPPYLFKDPRFSRTMGLWRKAYAKLGNDPITVIACRNPYAVAFSLARRDSFPKPHGLQLWESYMLEAELATRGLRRVLIHYDDLLKDPVAILRELARFIGLQGVLVSEAAASIDVQLKHDRETPAQFYARPQISQDLKELYRHLLTADPLSDVNFFDAARVGWRQRWQRLSPGPGPSQVALSRPETFLAKSKRAAENNNFTEGLKLARQAASMTPATAAIKYEVAKALHQNGDVDGAISALREVLAIDPEYPNGAGMLIQMLRGAGRLSEAVSAAADATGHAPGDAVLPHLHGELLIDQGDLAGAALCICRAIGLSGESAGHAMSLGRLALAAGWPDAAAGHAQRAAALMPDDRELQLQAARMLIKCGDHTAATGILLAMVPKHDAPADVLVLLARTLGAQGLFAEAAAQLQAAVNLEPGNTSYAEQLAHYLERAAKAAAKCVRG